MNIEAIKKKLMPHVVGYFPTVTIEELDDDTAFIHMTSYTSMDHNSDKCAGLSTPVGGFFSFYSGLSELTEKDVEEIGQSYCGYFVEVFTEHNEYKH